MKQSLMLIVNPRAGRARSAAPLFEAAALLCRDGETLLSIRQTAARGDATRFVRESGGAFDRIVCCGGDGTLNETVAGLMELPAPPPLGYIPAGSTNDFAASLHLPDRPQEAAAVISASAGRALDIGTFNGRPFVYVASFGAFTRASYGAPQSLKNDLGHLAYILEGVKDLSTLRPYPAVITAGDEVFDGEFLFGAVTNATSVGGLVKLKKEQVVLDDGLFELLLIPNPQNAQELQALLRSLLLQNLGGEGIILRHVSRLTVRTPEAFSWTLDGEYAPGTQEAEIVNHPRRLTFLL